MLGAPRVREGTPVARRRRRRLNFEAHGARGPSIMFETSQPNGWLVEQYAQVAPHPLSASLTESVYRLMPNKTDFTVFKQAGMRGLNFAFIGGHANYHTVNDDLATPGPAQTSSPRRAGARAGATTGKYRPERTGQARRLDLLQLSVSRHGHRAIPRDLRFALRGSCRAHSRSSRARFPCAAKH